MCYQEKKTIASMIAGVPVLAAYCIYGYQKVQSGGDAIGQDLTFWAITMLTFIGIGVAAAILTQIVFHIVFAAGGEIKRQVSAEIQKEIAKKTSAVPVGQAKGEDACAEIESEDEMDKLISLKASRIGSITTGAGFLIALVTLALRMPPAIMLNAVFLSFGLGSLLESIAQLHYYRRGV